MSQKTVFLKEFNTKEEAMLFKKTHGNVNIHRYEDRFMFLSIDEWYEGEQLPQETLDSSMLYIDDTNPLYCKLFRYMRASYISEYESPLEHDYVAGLTVKMFPKRTFIKGELQSTYWYADEEMTDLVLKVEIVYERDALGFATRRVTTRTWVLETGEDHPDVKTSVKLYDMLAQIKEGKRRRGNIIDGLMMPVLGMMQATITDMAATDVLLLGRAFLKTHQSAFKAFVDDSNKQLAQDIIAAEDEWLDNVINADGVTIRLYILDQINI